MKVYVLDSSYYGGELQVFKDKAKAEAEFDRCRDDLDEDEFELGEDRYNYFSAYNEDGDEEYARLEEHEVIE